MSSPFDDPVPRGLGVVQATLRITTAVVCWGWAARFLHLKTMSPVAGLLKAWLALPDARIAGIENTTAYALIVVGLLALVRPCWFILFPAYLWLTLAAVGSGFASPAYKPLAGLEHAAGSVAPLALLLIDFWPPKLKFSLGMYSTGLWLLRIGAAVSFIAQGVYAVIQSHFGGPWIDIMQQTLDHLAPREFTERDVQFALTVLGMIDVAVGFALWIRRSRIAALAAAVWGIVAAGFYTVASGETLYAETLVQAAMIGAPATLLIHYWLAIHEEPATVVAKSDFR
jgi:hypothetical protein